MDGRTCACGAPNPYLRARACPACSRASSKRYRDGHRPAAQRRYRELLPLRTPLELAVRKARAYLSVYVRRGKVAKTPCGACGATEVVAVQPWPSRPLVHAWACRQHRSQVEANLLAGEREPVADPRPALDVRIRRPAPAADVTRETVDRFLAQLEPNIAAALRARARRVGPIVVETTAPMYSMQLVRLVAIAIAEAEEEVTGRG